MVMTSTERARAYRAKLTPQERTAARLRSYNKRRVELVRAIGTPGPTGFGFACADCGVVHHESQLEIDHVDKVTWNVRACSPQMRVARYWREFKAGVRMRVLCGTCNARDGGRRRWRRYA